MIDVTAASAYSRLMDNWREQAFAQLCAVCSPLRTGHALTVYMGNIATGDLLLLVNEMRDRGDELFLQLSIGLNALKCPIDLLGFSSLLLGLGLACDPHPARNRPARIPAPHQLLSCIHRGTARPGSPAPNSAIYSRTLRLTWATSANCSRETRRSSQLPHCQKYSH